MCSALFPALVDIYRETFEKQILESVVLKPKCHSNKLVLPSSYGLMDITGVTGIHSDINSTTELEENDFLPFLDALMKSKTNCLSGHGVSRKRAYMGRYLNAVSHHHPIKKQDIVKTLVY